MQQSLLKEYSRIDDWYSDSMRDMGRTNPLIAYRRFLSITRLSHNIREIIDIVHTINKVDGDACILLDDDDMSFPVWQRVIEAFGVAVKKVIDDRAKKELITELGWRKEDIKRFRPTLTTVDACADAADD
jgi:hypothetical protein